jgi:shikimate 5-dehydrogenase/shikimate kinase
VYLNILGVDRQFRAPQPLCIQTILTLVAGNVANGGASNGEQSQPSMSLPTRSNAAMGQRPRFRVFHRDASVVLIGSRGAGKRTLGFIAMQHLRRRLITEDRVFEETTNLTKAAYLSKFGKDAFGRQSAEVFKRMLDEYRTHCIIECGISSITPEAQQALREYCATNPVIYIHRETERVREFLYADDADSILAADPSHRQCSNLEYYNLFEQPSNALFPQAAVPNLDSRPFTRARVIDVKKDFSRYLDLVFGKHKLTAWSERPFSVDAIPLEMRQYSYALRLRLSYLANVEVDWEDFEGHGDCIELIVDHWPSNYEHIIARQVSLIRRKLRYPIIYHVEENPLGEGVRPPEKKDAMDRDLLELGLRLGVEYISLDMQRNPNLLRHVLERRGQSKIIGNYWHAEPDAPPWSDDVHAENYVEATEFGCAVVRMARFSDSHIPVRELESFQQKLDENLPPARPPLAAYDYSIMGIRTPFQSRILNPVKHGEVESVREPIAREITAPQAFGSLFTQMELDPLKFYVVGSNVTSSLLPAMHEAAFEHWGMRGHTFDAISLATLNELYQLSQDPRFGGAYLSAPFKVAIGPKLAFKSHHAEAIGAVNVLIPLRGKSPYILDSANSRNRKGVTDEFWGDNIDWQTILSCIRRHNSPRNFVNPATTTALVIGAGGMARAAVYALYQWNVRNIFIYNRTVEHARDVADYFNDWAAKQAKAGGSVASGTVPEICRVLTSTTQQWPSTFRPPTCVISSVPTGSVDGEDLSDFEMPLQWLQSQTGGVALEVRGLHANTRIVPRLQSVSDSAHLAANKTDSLGTNLRKPALWPSSRLLTRR